MIEHKIIGLDLVKDTEEKVQIIQLKLKAASDKQRSYANLKRKDIEYEVRDKVFLKYLCEKRYFVLDEKEN